MPTTLLKPRWLALCGAVAGLTLAAPAAHAAGGDLVSAKPVDHRSRAEVVETVRRFKLDTARARHGVDAYRLVYRTNDARGRPTTASGLLVLPRNVRRDLRTVAWEHGTTVARRDAPSTGAGSDARLVALLFGSAGFATVAPDYLGLGVGAGHHAFEHTATEVSASLDMLRAARAFAAGQGRRLDERVLVTGFSQGGKVAMGLGRALQDGADPRLRLGALAPISGPYDLAGAELPAILAGRTDPRDASLVVAYSLVSWNRLYHVYDRPGDAFRPPYDRTVPSLLDGRHSQRAVFAGLPASPRRLLTPRFMESLRRPAGPILQGLRASDGTCDWRPRVPVRLYAARGDRAVVFANSRHCRAALRAHGGAAPLIDLGPVGHFDSERRAVPRVLRWFQGVR